MEFLPGQSAPVASAGTAPRLRRNRTSSIRSRPAARLTWRTKTRPCPPSLCGLDSRRRRRGLGLARARRAALSAWLGGARRAHAGLRGSNAACLFPALLHGVVGHVIGFHWVYQTVRVFGGFGPPGAALVFAIFVGHGALQFLAIALIDRQLDRAFDALAMRSATAVVLAELLMPRLFPWHFGHTQIAFTPFVQVAGIGGAMAVSFLMFWLAEVGRPRRRLPRAAARSSSSPSPSSGSRWLTARR